MITIKPNKDGFKESAIRKFQEKIGLKFTRDYLEFLKKSNGGTPESNIVRLDGQEINSFSITSFFGIETEPANDILSQYVVFGGRIPQGCIPIAYIEGGNLLCLNLNRHKYGYVLLWDHDKEEIEADSLPVVAKSFSDFLGKINSYNPSKEELSDYKIQEVWIDPEFMKELEKGSED